MTPTPLHPNDRRLARGRFVVEFYSRPDENGARRCLRPEARFATLSDAREYGNAESANAPGGATVRIVRVEPRDPRRIDGPWARKVIEESVVA